MGKIFNLVGQQFGRGRVKHKTLNRKHGSVVWELKCSCGKSYYATTRELNAGYVKSCGCLQRDQKIAVRNYNRLRKPIQVLKKSTNWRTDMACIRIIEAILQESEQL